MTYNLEEPAESLLRRQPVGAFIIFGTAKDDPEGLVIHKYGAGRWEVCEPQGKNYPWEEKNIIYLLMYNDSP